MPPSTDVEIVVAGAGPAGMAAALLLGRTGRTVALVGPEAAEDRRTVALMVPALETLDRLDVRAAVEAVGAPLRLMRIIDGSKRLLRAPTVTFSAAEIDEPYFGINLRNADLMAILRDEVDKSPSVRWHRASVAAWRLEDRQVTAELSDGNSLTARAAVAADGRKSAAREAAGITVRQSDLSQSALVLTFAHSREHGSVSTEFHTETGPFTIVPLPGRRSSLVWVLEPEMAMQLAALDDADLSRRVEARMSSMLGEVIVEEGRQIFPLSSAAPSSFASRRVALVGEAAHLFPPIGAQGLNLGLRDVSDLVDIMMEHQDDPGSDEAMRAYDKARRPDVLSRSTAVNLLNRSLLSDALPIQLVRATGLAALSSVSPLRALFMREGMRPGSGLLGMLPSIRGKGQAGASRS